MAESEVESGFSGIKTAQNSKTEGGIERKREHENVKLKKDVQGRFYFEFEKNQKNANPCAIGVQLQLALRSKRTQSGWMCLARLYWVPEIYFSRATRSFVGCRPTRLFNRNWNSSGTQGILPLVFYKIPDQGSS